MGTIKGEAGPFDTVKYMLIKQRKAQSNGIEVKRSNKGFKIDGARKCVEI